MKQQEVFNRIGGIIKELNDQFKYLQDDPAKINELELELFVANAHFLANHAEVLKKISQQEQPVLPPPAVQTPERSAPTEERYFEPVVQKPQPVDDSPVPSIDLSSDTPEDDYSYIRQSEPEIIKHELEIDESWADDEEEEEVTEIPELDPEPELIPPIPEKPIAVTPVPPIVVEEKPISPPAKKEEQTEPLTINQRMSAQMSNKHETASSAISDLKSAITLNDKLLFVKDLFNGYSLAYSEAIDILNKFSNFDEADKYLKGNYYAKNNWESKPQASEKFYSFLKRRYA